jgi:hypothetical protein
LLATNITHSGGLPVMSRSASPDVVHLHPVRALAELTPIGKEPGDQLLVRVGPDRLAVGQDRHLLPFQWDPREPGDQWGLPSRSKRASKQVRKPCGVTILALNFRAIFDTVERCLAARVWSIEVSITHRSR